MLRCLAVGTTITFAPHCLGRQWVKRDYAAHVPDAIYLTRLSLDFFVPYGPYDLNGDPCNPVELTIICATYLTSTVHGYDEESVTAPLHTKITRGELYRLVISTSFGEPV